MCFLRFSSFDGTDVFFVGSFLLRGASAGASFACAHTPHPPQAVPLPPRWGRLLLFYKPFYSHTRFRFFCTQAFTLEGEGGFSGAGRKKTRMRVCFLLMEPTRFLSVLSFYVVLLLVRRSLALTPLFQRKRSPFPPSGEGLVVGCYLRRGFCRFFPSTRRFCWYVVRLRSHPSSVGYAATFPPGGEGFCYSSNFLSFVF